MMRIEDIERRVLCLLNTKSDLTFKAIEFALKGLAIRKTIRRALKKLVESGRVKHWFYNDMPYYSLRGVNNAQ